MQGLVGEGEVEKNDYGYRLNESKLATKRISSMNRTTKPAHVVRKVIISLLTANLGLLILPSSSIAAREYFYKDCAELQKVINDYNPTLTVKGFEKVSMKRRYLDYEVRMVFCNGGIIIDREVGTVCRGYIGYSFSRIGGGANYYVRWGRTEGLPNDGDTGAEKYCRLIK
jgi:hypothetical protein